MDTNQEQLASLQEIRNIMDRSSRFISLSGLSGVGAGVSALVGAAVVKWFFIERNIDFPASWGRDLSSGDIWFLAALSTVILIIACSVAVLFTIRNARRKNLRTWDNQSKRLLVNLAIPLGAGGAFCGLLLNYDLFFLVAPAMLIFYGLALLNGSKYTYGDIRYLGVFEIILGLIAGFFPGFGLMLWTLGFGVLHIVYGIVVYQKYERRETA